MPFVADLYKWQIEQLEKIIEQDSLKALVLSSAIKRRANTMKNYRGKLQGMARLDITRHKRDEQKKMLEAFASEPEKQHQLENILEEIESIYSEKQQIYQRQLLLTHLFRSSTLLSTARTLYEHAEDLTKADLDRKSAYMNRNLKRTKKSTLLKLEGYDQSADRLLLSDLLERIRILPADNRIQALDENLFESGIKKLLSDLDGKSRLSDPEVVATYWDMDTLALIQTNDPAIALITTLMPELRYFEQMNHRHSGALKHLHAQLIELRKGFFKDRFVPDANGTMRLTYGRIRGYSPADGIYYQPITTFSGVIEKTTGRTPYITPPELIAVHENRDLEPYIYPALQDVAVGILYDMDTTGGNSGSPVFNARGELVGVNFDRAFEATINDYAWNQNYSRSIGVDIRYILWILDKYSGANHILEDLRVRD